jgi:hypothetical protein
MLLQSVSREFQGPRELVVGVEKISEPKNEKKERGFKYLQGIAGVEELKLWREWMKICQKIRERKAKNVSYLLFPLYSQFWSSPLCFWTRQS